MDWNYTSATVTAARPSPCDNRKQQQAEEEEAEAEEEEAEEKEEQAEEEGDKRDSHLLFIISPHISPKLQQHKETESNSQTTQTTEITTLSIIPASNPE